MLSKSLWSILFTLQHPPDASAPRVGVQLQQSSTPLAAPPRVPPLPRAHIEPTAPTALPPLAPLRARPLSDDRLIALRTRARYTALSFNLPALHSDKDSTVYRALSNFSYTRMILLKGKALAKDKWITVTKFSQKPQPSISQGPPSTNQYAILADTASTPAL